MKDCCKTDRKNKEDRGNKGEKGWKQGIIYGILPHSFCIAFVVFSVIGATAATTIFKKFLSLPYFFEILIGLSFLFATLSAIFYLRRKSNLSVKGIRENWGYLGILYGTTIIINMLFFLVIFPMVANVRGTIAMGSEIRKGLSTITLAVKIPCSGHAPLIIDELKKIAGVKQVEFRLPSLFVVSYDSSKVSPLQITSLPIFTEFPIEIK